MSAPNSSSSIPSIIEPLHNPQQKAVILEPSNKAGMEMGVGKMHLGAKGFLMKKMAAAGLVTSSLLHSLHYKMQQFEGG